MRKHRIATTLDRPNGAVAAVDGRKLYEYPFFLTPTNPNVAITVPAGQATDVLQAPVSGEGPAQIETLSYQRTGACQVRLGVQDGELMRYISNRFIHADTIFGNGQRAFSLPEALFVDETRSLAMIWSDLSGETNTVRPIFGTARYTKPETDPILEKVRSRMDFRQYMSAPYFYTLDAQVATIGAGQTAQGTITVGTDHNFEVLKITGLSTGRYTFQITDINTGEPFFDGFGGGGIQVENTLVVGTPGFPYTLKEKRFWSAGTKLLVEVTDISGAPNAVFLTLSGRMIATRMWRS